MAYKVGLKRFFYQDTNRLNWEGTGPRPLVTDIWYPAVDSTIEEDVFIGVPEAPLFKVCKAGRDAELNHSPEKFPLILLSHGTGGASLQLGWVGAYLASCGYITAAVNHHGNNGLEPYVAKGFLHYWERPKDLTAVLNSMLADATFNTRINIDQIGACGFSLGGYTVLSIAGAMTHLEGMMSAYSNSEDLSREIPPEFTDHAAFLEEFKLMGSYISVADASYQDKRIKAVFSIAPVLGEAVSPTGLSAIKIPIKIIVGEIDQLAPSKTNASFFATHIEHVELTLMPNVGHYTFLAEATDIGKRAMPMLCSDAAGIDRASIHQITNEWVFDFFEKHLKV